VYLHDYATFEEAIGIQIYFLFYNTERQHQSLGYKTPQEVYELQEPAALCAANKFVYTLGDDVAQSELC